MHTLAFCGAKKRLFIKSGSGRQRFNVLGALNAVTHELIMVTHLSPGKGASPCFIDLWDKTRTRSNRAGSFSYVEDLVTNETYINAQSVCELLNKLAGLGLSIPITLVLDNARYQKCAVVMELAQSLNIELLYLTAYSTYFYLIERLWKFVKKQCLYSIYYPDFSAFKAAITSCLNQCHTTYKQELDSLLTLRFQSFKKVKTIP